MGHSQATKREHHETVGVAATLLREDGLDGVGVADLMRDAGLTHGGFYRHFESRDELVAEAVERALHDGGQAMAAVAESPRDPLAAVIDAYLSTTHRDNLGTSCAVTTLAADIARSNARAQAAYTEPGRRLHRHAGLAPPARIQRRSAQNRHRRLVDARGRRVDGACGQRRTAVTGDPGVGGVEAEGAAPLNHSGSRSLTSITVPVLQRFQVRESADADER